MSMLDALSIGVAGSASIPELRSGITITTGLFAASLTPPPFLSGLQLPCCRRCSRSC